MTTKKIACYSYSVNNLNEENAMGYLRIIAPYTLAGYEIISGFVNNQLNVDVIRLVDYVIIQREFPAYFPAYKQIIQNAQKYQKPVIYEIDDLLFFLPKNHPDRLTHNFSSSLLPIWQAVHEADFVTVSTKRLKDNLFDTNPNIFIIPNFFDDKLWKLKTPILKDNNDQELIIGYMGTNSHQPDLLPILPIIKKLINNYPKKLKFRIWGLKPPDEFLIGGKIEWSPFYSMNYREFAQFFQTQSADIFISPLIENEFNKCKSPIKFFEYTSLGVPGIYSSIEPYSGIIKNNVTGVLAESIEDWERNLTTLIQDPKLRYQLAVNAQIYVKGNWLLSENRNTINNFLEKVNDYPKRKLTKNINVIESINQQNFDYFRYIQDKLINNENVINQLNSTNHQLENYLVDAKEEIYRLRNEVQDKNDKIRNLQNEIALYYLSRSWRITRPFRKIKKYFQRNKC